MKRRRKGKRRSRRVIAIGIGALILCLAGFIIYTQAKNIGFAEGKTVGYDNGYDEGYDKGYDNGYLVGHDSGYDEGQTIGYRSGYDNGYISGLDIGRTYGYTIEDPTYLEMHSFLERDTTDQNEYVENVYTCRNFAADVCNHADEENIRCAYVVIDFPEGCHAIVAFNTVDRGLIFIIPPQEDPRFQTGDELSLPAIYF